MEGQDLVEQDVDKVKGIKFLQRNLSMISNDMIRHDPSLVAESIIELICDDLKYQDKQNDPQYLMLNTKLREEKRINKIKKRMAKKEKKQRDGKAVNEKERKGKSKFSSKYSDRIESIREADEKARRKVQKEQVKRKKTRTALHNNEDIATLKRKSSGEKINRTKGKTSDLREKRESTTKPKSARGRKKTPEEIRKEMLKKLNETK